MGYCCRQLHWSLALLGSILLGFAHTCYLNNARDECPHHKYQVDTFKTIVTDDNVEEHCQERLKLFSCISEKTLLEDCTGDPLIHFYRQKNLTTTLCSTKLKPDFKSSVDCFKSHETVITNCTDRIDTTHDPEDHCGKWDFWQKCIIIGYKQDCSGVPLETMAELVHSYIRPISKDNKCDIKKQDVPTQRPLPTSTVTSTSSLPSSSTSKPTPRPTPKSPSGKTTMSSKGTKNTTQGTRGTTPHSSTDKARSALTTIAMCATIVVFFVVSLI